MDRTYLNDVMRWSADREVQRFLWDPYDQSAAQMEEFLTKHANTERQRSFAIILPDGKVIGRIHLRNIDYRHGTASLLVVVGEKSLWGQGYGADATRTLLRYAFDELRVQRVEANAETASVAALRLLEKCGFQLEGTRRKAVFARGEHRDVHLFGVLRDEFISGQPDPL